MKSGNGSAALVIGERIVKGENKGGLGGCGRREQG